MKAEHVEQRADKPPPPLPWFSAGEQQDYKGALAGIWDPHLDLVHLELPLDGGVLTLQAGQPRLDVLIGGDEGKVGG